MLTLYDAERCPYVGRVRIVLAEKQIPYESVWIDLGDKPAWLYEKNPAGRVPVVEEDGGLVLAESAVIMEYLEERFPEPALLPADPAERALARLRIWRHDDFSSPYYAVRRGDEGAHERFDAALRALDAILEAQPYLTGPRVRPRRHRVRPLDLPWAAVVRARRRAPPRPIGMARAPARAAFGRSRERRRRSPVTLVLLHAFPLDERMWEPLGRDDAVAPRLYGPGETMDEWAAGVLEQVDGPFLACGASMGGYCALAIARRAPERLTGLVLAGARVDADSPERRAGRADTIELIRSRGPSGLWDDMLPKVFHAAPPEAVELARDIALDQPPHDLVRAVERFATAKTRPRSSPRSAPRS